MTTFKQYLAELENQEIELPKLIDLFEHEIYKRIPGSSNSYRQDSANTQTLTQLHSHVYAKLNGRGAELYSVNFSGSGHDGSSGTKIPTVHADFFRSKGYAIPSDNVLESLNVELLDEAQYSILLLVDA